MYPGLVGIGDTPKMQMVGAVLGTPHSPGYPLYVWLSWIFTHLPFGTVAFRVNLLSAVSGAAAVGVLTLVLCELGCRGAVAFAAALAIGFGRLYWSQSLLAEVYALNALLFALVLRSLLRWARAQHFGDLAMALVWFAAGLAHHLTLAMTAPALLAFALMTDRHVLTRRVVVTATAICLAGLSCYLFVWLRTHEQAAFLEVRAEKLSDLPAIVSGKQFESALFRFGLDDLVTVRVPRIFQLLLDEVHPIGMLLAAIGIAWLTLTRRNRDVVLLGGGALTVLFFALNYDVYDIQVFLLIPMIVIGLLAGVGAEALARGFTSIPALALAGRAPAWAASFAVLAVPYAMYQSNVKVNNHHRHTFESAYFDALFDVLPDRSAIVAESYPVDNLILYKLIAENAAHERRIELIPDNVEAVRKAVANGYTVFAFARGRQELEFKVPFKLAPYDLPQPTGGRHIADTEVPQLAYPLSIAVIDPKTLAAPTREVAPTSGTDPMTGAVWRPSGTP